MQPYGIYPLNNWYVAAFSADVKGEPLARKICNQPVVLFRSSAGRVAALEDRCIHRGMPLSKGGECDGEILRCPYHGLEFDTAGTCTKVPGQDRVPPGAQLRSYPAVEKDAMIWVWMGDKQKADPSTIPSHPYHSDPGWAWSPILLEMACDWQLLNDNLLDLTHLAFVHKKTIGGDPAAHTKDVEIKTTREGRKVDVKRWLPNSAPPPFYSAGYQFKGKIDRWQEIEFVPGFIRIWSGGTDAGTGAYEGRRVAGVQFMGLHAVTPSTATTCYYHFTQSRNFKADGPAELHKRIHEGALVTLLEDQTILATQMARLLEDPERELIDIKWDAGPLQARRIIEQMCADESGNAKAPAGRAYA